MKIKLALFLTALSILLSGCETLVVAGAATGASAAQDRRDIGTQLDDEKTEIQSFAEIFNDDELWKDTNISVISYNKRVLIIGQAPTASLKQKAGEAVKGISGDKKTHNQIRIAAPISFYAKRADDLLTTKVKSAMLFSEDFSSGRIKVVSENGEVFLLGLVTQAEAVKAVEITRQVAGVKKVIKVFEYLEGDAS